MYPLPFIRERASVVESQFRWVRWRVLSSDGVFPQGWQLGLFLLERRSHVGAGLDLDLDRVVRLGLDHDFAPVFEGLGSVGTAIEPSRSDHDRAALGFEHEVDMPLEQPRAVGRSFTGLGGSLAALDTLLSILPDKGPNRDRTLRSVRLTPTGSTAGQRTGL